MVLFTVVLIEGTRDTEKVLRHIEVAVTDAMNAKLCAPFTDEEIEAALFRMGPTKAPGPDGLPAMFYQKHWALLKEDVCAAIREFLAGQAAPTGFNDTVIVMIPKVNSPELLSQFRLAYAMFYIRSPQKHWLTG